MGKLDDLLMETLIAEAVAKGDVEPDQNDLEEKLTEVIPAIIKAESPRFLNEIKKGAKGNLKWQRKQTQGFERRLVKHWEKPLDLLELTIGIAQEIGEGVGDEVASGEAVVEEHTFTALRAIHARACQISRAILTLLRSGFADDAHARWRSVHELNVVANFIAEQGDEVAERYLLHGVVQQRKLARAYKEHEVTANLEPLAQSDMDVLDNEYENLVARFGKSFTEEYGWAACALNNKQPSMAEIERSMELDYLRPYYRMASDNIHANSHGTFYKLGIYRPETGILLAGPSNLGLADPGHGTALSLTQITVTLVTTSPTLDSLMAVSALILLEEETGTAFLQAHEAAEAIAERESEQTASESRHKTRRKGGNNIATRLRNEVLDLLP